MPLNNHLKLNEILYIIIFFYLFYLPKVTELFLSIPSQLVVLVLFFIFGIFRINNIFSERIDENYSKRVIVKWGFCIFYLSSYTAIIAMINDKPNRMFQYLYTFVWLLTLYWYKKIILDSLFTNNQIVEMIFIFGAIQGLICIMMLIFPQFKEVANQLYYLGGERNVFRTEKRIYGISNDYTFFTPCYHGFLASFCLLYSITQNKKLLIAVPFIFLSTFLNNRTGILIFVVNALALSFLLMFNPNIDKHIKINIQKSIAILSIFIVSVLMFIKHFNPKTYEYTINGILSAKEWANEQSYQIYFPKGLSFIFGNGDVQAGVTRRKYGWSMDRISDYGYVNDMFIGGIVYCFCLYLTNFRFIFYKSKEYIFNFKMLCFDIMSLITLIISNYKGQSMKSGFLIVAILFIKLVLLDYLSEREKENANVNLRDDCLQRED